ncbi:hypothetical protein [Dyadobacter sp. Leaf189]|uniref:hypothetical protein n=1 Tax=Dyadobacter sp. Leaf189 TaxID=1736295 RepID=UPI0006F4929D|nr:hypothetical protein [Dyadobacter sp. Leaf189]KQS31007.1 hypothetical protein ASG33_11630 [Dyadobacter sp. Leaf189]
MRKNFVLLAMLGVSVLFVAARFAADTLVGTWKYTVSNVSPEYQSGTMTFEEKGGKIAGYLGSTDRSEMKELKINQDKVNFKLDFQGSLITIDMVQKGDTLKGIVVTNDGEFPIEATREAK